MRGARPRLRSALTKPAAISLASASLDESVDTPYFSSVFGPGETVEEFAMVANINTAIA